MYWREDRDKEIETLKAAIQETAFKNGKIIAGDEQADIPFDETKISLESFVHKIAEKIWKHQQHIREDDKEALLSDGRKEKNHLLLEIKKFLSESQLKFSKTAIKEVMKILAKDSDRLFDPNNFSKDVKGSFQFNPLAPAWIERENFLIGHIRDLYQFTPICGNEYRIAYSIAKIFEASKLWPDKKNHFETMRKRIQEIDYQKNLSQ